MAEFEVLRTELDPIPSLPYMVAALTVRYGELKVHGVRLIETRAGDLRLHFPDRPVQHPCVHHGCGQPVPIFNGYCGHCGGKQPYREAQLKTSGHKRLFYQVLYPIGSEARAAMELVAMNAYFDARRQSPRLGVVA